MLEQEVANLESQSNNEDQGTQEAQTTQNVKTGQETTQPADVLDFLNEEPNKGAPAEYGEFTFAAGNELNEDQLGKFIEFAKKSGLTQEAAQATLDYNASVRVAELEVLSNQVGEWIKEASSDPVIMNGKVAIQQVLSTAPESLIRKGKVPEGESGGLLRDLGLHNNPDFLRWMVSISKGAAMQEQPIINGNPRPSQTKTGLDRII